MSRCSGVFEQYAVFGSSGFARARAALLFAAVVSLTNMSALEQYFRTQPQWISCFTNNGALRQRFVGQRGDLGRYTPYRARLQLGKLLVCMLASRTWDPRMPALGLAKKTFPTLNGRVFTCGLSAENAMFARSVRHNTPTVWRRRGRKNRFLELNHRASVAAKS